MPDVDSCTGATEADTAARCHCDECGKAARPLEFLASATLKDILSILVALRRPLHLAKDHGDSAHRVREHELYIAIIRTCSGGILVALPFEHMAEDFTPEPGLSLECEVRRMLNQWKSLRDDDLSETAERDCTTITRALYGDNSLATAAGLAERMLLRYAEI